VKKGNMIMETVPQQHRLRTWLAASIALHFLVVLFLATRAMIQESSIAKVLFIPPQKKIHTAQTPLVQAPVSPPAPQPQTQEEVDFFLDLHKTTKFGYGAKVAQGDEPGGDESSEPAETAQKSETLPSEQKAAPESSTSDRGPIEKIAEQQLEGSHTGGSPGPKNKLARLFEGFLDYMSDPRREEMIDYHAPDKRYADYMRKVGWALQNSFYLNNKPLTLEQDVHIQVTLVLEIGRDGVLRTVAMAPHTSEEVLNKHILKIIQKAAPFARLPDDFKRTCMKIKLPVYVDAQQGTHTYYLQF
jgi:hypothetical protein